MVCHGIREGLRTRRAFLFAAVLFWLAGIGFSVEIVGVYQAEHPQGTVSVADAVLYCFRGMEKMNQSGIEREFRLPMFWIILLLWSSISVLGYAEEVTPYGQIVFLRSGRRSIWWISKCIWNFFVTLSYFTIGLLTLVLMAKGNGWRITAHCTEDLLPYLFPESMEVPAAEIGKLVLPVIFGSAAWNLFQMYLALYGNGFISLLSTCGMMAGSVYCFSPFLLGNYMMIARSSRIVRGGMDAGTGYVLSLAVMFWAVCGGMIKVKRMDYLAKET